MDKKRKPVKRVAKKQALNITSADAFKFAIKLKGTSTDVFDEIITVEKLRTLLGKGTTFFGPYFKDSECGFIVCEGTDKYPDAGIAYPCGPSVTADSDPATFQVGVLVNENDEMAFIFFVNNGRKGW